MNIKVTNVYAYVPTFPTYVGQASRYGLQIHQNLPDMFLLTLTP